MLGCISGFLFLLVVGWILDPLVLGTLLIVARRRGPSAEALIGYGLGFTAFVDVRLWGNLFLFTDPNLVAWTIVGLAIGPALLMAGFLLLWRRQPGPPV